MSDVAKPSGMVDELVAARTSDAVLKTEFATLRSWAPAAVILVFEGDTDKRVYRHWVRRVCPEALYEPFPCGTKRRVLGLKATLDRDLNGLKRGVYYFIDRDFDDCFGIELDSSVFMTDRYSIENYLVSDEVLDEILKVVFHCHGKDAVRRPSIVEEFHRCLQQFIEAVRDLNLLLYVCRKGKIRIGKVPNSLATFVSVKIGMVKIGAQSPLQFLAPDRIPLPPEFDGVRRDFDELEPIKRYRGKFFLWFFHQWLELLARERKCGHGLFEGINQDGAIHHDGFSIDNMASMSCLPCGFTDFVKNIDWLFMQERRDN